MLRHRIILNVKHNYPLCRNDNLSHLHDMLQREIKNSFSQADKSIFFGRYRQKMSSVLFTALLSLFFKGNAVSIYALSIRKNFTQPHYT